jgi:hypothetical protein
MAWYDYLGAGIGAGVGALTEEDPWKGAWGGGKKGATTTAAAMPFVYGANLGQGGMMGGGWGEAMTGGTTGTSPTSPSGLSSLDKWSLALQGLGTAAQAYGGYQQGRAYDEEMEYRRRIEEEDREKRERAGRNLGPILERYLRS